MRLHEFFSLPANWNLASSCPGPLWQAEWVAARLTERGAAIELVPISTRGDREQQGPIGSIAGGDGVFTKELERALLAGEIDLAVHSLKDLPTAMPPELVLAAVPRRGPTGDVLSACGAAILLV